MTILLAITLVGGLCLLTGVTGLQEGSLQTEAILNLALGLAMVLSAGWAFLGKRRSR